jgi:hypothetical protein
MRTTNMLNLLAASLLACAAACSGTARGLEAYRTDTTKLVETRNRQIQGCYEDALKTEATLAGTVTVQFIVEKQTGAIAYPMIQQDKTTAPAVLAQCVVRAVDGLVLAPPDRNEGQATFVYEFKPTPAPSASRASG